MHVLEVISVIVFFVIGFAIGGLITESDILERKLKRRVDRIESAKGVHGVKRKRR